MNCYDVRTWRLAGRFLDERKEALRTELLSPTGTDILYILRKWLYGIDCKVYRNEVSNDHYLINMTSYSYEKHSSKQ